MASMLAVLLVAASATAIHPTLVDTAVPVPEARTSQARTTMTTEPCDGPGSVMLTVERRRKRVGVGFALTDAPPLQEYRFGVEFAWTLPGRSPVTGVYDGAATTTLFGTADLSGTSAPARARLRYRLVALGEWSTCRLRGVVTGR